MNYCTFFDWNYVGQGLALHSSMEQHCKPYHLWILALCDRTWEFLSHAALPNVTVVKLSTIETAKLTKVKTERSWKEYIWTLTGWWVLWCLRRQQLECVNYIDADCFFFSSPDSVFEEIGATELAITPHRFAPEHKHWEVNGLYNVGLLYATQYGQACIEKWANLCLQWCCATAEDGKFADQKYFDTLVPKYHIHVIQHLGANLAPWNAAQYRYSFTDGLVWVESYPLIWYHFHQGFAPRWAIPTMLLDKVYPAYRRTWEEIERVLC